MRAVLAGHAARFRGARRVLDVGCGSGIFLDLLAKAGTAAAGIEVRPEAAAAAAARGHDVRRAAALPGLAALAAEGARFDGVFCSHLVEHLPPEDVPGLFRAVAEVLEPGGRAVFVTPNPRNLLVLTELFWLDPTHVRPWPRRILEELGRAAGLTVVESREDPATIPRRPPLRRLLARLRSALSGADRSSPLDSVVVFAKRC